MHLNISGRCEGKYLVTFVGYLNWEAAQRERQHIS